MNLWYSSDPHFFHDNILRFDVKCRDCGGTGRQPVSPPDLPCPDCGGVGTVRMRPFRDITEMHETILDAHNSRVRPQDHWWCLGDVVMDRQPREEHLRFLRRLNGHKRLILGNHDHWPVEAYVRAGFEKVRSSHKHDSFLFTHYPVHPRSIPARLVNVHGHVHSNEAPEGRYINISLEMTGYAPVTLDELRQKATLLPTERCVCPASPCPRHGYGRLSWPKNDAFHQPEVEP